jgi:hypothetical protein
LMLLHGLLKQYRGGGDTVVDTQEIKTVEAQPKIKLKWWNYVLAVLAFWVLSLFGGVIPMLINALQPQFARYMPGDLGYAILYISATAIGCIIAVAAFNGITEHRSPVCGLVNCIIAFLFMLFLCVSTFFTGLATWERTIAYVLVFAVYIYAIVKYSKQIKVEAKPKESRAVKRWPYIACIIVLFCCLAGSSVLLYYSNSYYKYYKAETEELNEEISNKELVVSAYLENINYLKSRNNELASFVDFINNNVVFVTEAGGKYHRYDCQYFQERDGWCYVFNVEYAQWLGYHPCLVCDPPQ